MIGETVPVYFGIRPLACPGHGDVVDEEFCDLGGRVLIGAGPFKARRVAKDLCWRIPQLMVAARGHSDVSKSGQNGFILATIADGSAAAGPRCTDRAVSLFLVLWLANEIALTGFIVRHKASGFNFGRAAGDALVLDYVEWSGSVIRISFHGFSVSEGRDDGIRRPHRSVRVWANSRSFDCVWRKRRAKLRSG